MGRSEESLELSHGASQARIGSKRGRPTIQNMRVSSDKLPKWSKEALLAMETHLSLLKRGAASQAKRSFMEEESGHGGPLVELNSHAPLPRGWEQFLDLRTGQVYYIDWNSFKRSYTDPRKVQQLANEKVFSLLEHRSVLTEPANSECITDGSNNAARISSNCEVEVESKWAFPMVKEDWDLVNARGWLLPTCDDHSEVESSSSSCAAHAEEK